MRSLFLLLAFQVALFSHSDNHSHIEDDGTGTVNGYYVGPNVSYPYHHFNLADFEGADLSGADLTGCTFVLANFTDANLSGANLSNANFYSANLTNANLDDAIIVSTNFTNANLSNISINGLVSLTEVGDAVQINWSANTRLILNESTNLINWSEVNGINGGGINTYFDTIDSRKFYKISVN